MHKFKWVVLAAVACFCLIVTAPKANAQVRIGVDIGTPPECPYGYYDAPPYGCAPYGYYGPEWFTDGVFIGAGPWFHGRDDFRGHVDTRFHPDHGYKGPMPKVGEKSDESKRLDRIPNFKGNEMRDGRGHAGDGEKR